MRLYPQAVLGDAIDATEGDIRELLAPSLLQILQCQSADGGIYWFADSSYLDVWNMLEAAMGLASAGELAAAQRALDWLAPRQTPQGGWYEAYALDEPLSLRQQTHHAAYAAVAYLYLLRAGAADGWVRAGFATVERALDFVVAQQLPGGSIAWRVEDDGEPQPRALVTASASVYLSLRSGLELAQHLGQERPHWQRAADALARALNNPNDEAWQDKSDYSMDWFYPVLAGLYPQRRAQRHLQGGWHRFVKDELGCYCRHSQPWVTTAETCELVLALLRAGERERALQLYCQALRLRDGAGRLWTGYQHEVQGWWPNEQPSWTSGVAWMAADALFALTPAGQLWRGY